MTRARRAAAAAAAAILAAGPGTACTDLMPPDRPAAYPFRLAPEGLAFHWPADRLPVRYWAEPIGAVPDYVAAGLAAWERQFLYGEFRAALEPDSARADVIVVLDGAAPPAASLTGDPPVDACGGSTAFELATPERLQRAPVIHLRWFAGHDPVDVANCLARVTAHELGHSLGLLAHSDDPDDLMYGAPYGFPEVREPSPRDRATARRVYDTPADLAPAPR